MNSADTLYLDGYLTKENNKVLISIESFISAFVYQYCGLQLNVCLVCNRDVEYPCTIYCDAFKTSNSFLNSKSTNQDLRFMLPAVVTNDGKTIIAGLCGTLRWVIKNHLLLFPDHHCVNLLGFRGGCLVACTESSIWTRFCELQLPESVKEVSSKLKDGSYFNEIPPNLMLLEEHLKRPVRTHNILKRKLDIAKQVKQQNSPNSSTNRLATNFTLFDQNSIPVKENAIEEKLRNMVITEKSEDFSLNHCYLEGIDLSLADMIVFPCVYYLLNKLPSQAFKHLVHVIKWYKRMWSNKDVRQAAESCRMHFTDLCEKEDCKSIEHINITVPVVEQISLYKRDPSHTKIKCKYRSPDKIISFLQAANIHPKYVTTYCSTLEWGNLPPALHPSQGDLPQKRLERKCQQIESLVTAVLKIAKKNQTIVEFCAGGGHVGLLLAYNLPSCKILLIENKESSIMRAKSRAEILKLSNVYFYQCNLDYFKGSFDIGVSLHACGVATDLVIQQCISQKASFVCCPCCYGMVQDTHLLSYPLSKRFQNTGLSKKDFTLLAHFADRTEVNTPTAAQGELCMGLIDTDRLSYAAEQCYKAELTTLNPLTCSPKHNLLIGISPSYQ